MKIVVVNGPNLNLLGKREPDVYGTRTLADLNEMVREAARQRHSEVALLQSNIEGAVNIASSQPTRVRDVVETIGRQLKASDRLRVRGACVRRRGLRLGSCWGAAAILPGSFLRTRRRPIVGEPRAMRGQCG